MALEKTVSTHENPLEKVVIWEKRLSADNAKHRERCSTVKTVDKSDLIVIRDSEQESKDDYHRDYCVIAAATKATRVPVRPPLLSSRTTSLKLSDRNYESFSRRHLGGELVSPSRTVTTQPLPPSHNNNDRHLGSQTRVTTTAFKSKPFVNEGDVKLFCCDQDVEQMVEYCTCLCCVKGLFYHCTKDTYGEGSMAERPCACGPVGKGCFKRWTCLSICSVFLPCLLCYIPAKCCLDVGKCYKEQRMINVHRVTRLKEPH